MVKVDESITEQYPLFSLIIALIIITCGSFVIYANQNPVFDIGVFLFWLIVWVYPLFLFMVFLFYFFIRWLEKE